MGVVSTVKPGTRDTVGQFFDAGFQHVETILVRPCGFDAAHQLGRWRAEACSIANTAERITRYRASASLQRRHSIAVRCLLLNVIMPETASLAEWLAQWFPAPG